MAFAHAWGAGYGFGLGFLNLIGTVLFFILVVWVIRFVLRGGFGYRGERCGGWRGYRRGRRYRRHRYAGFGDDPLEEARSRLARGEIDAQEYERLRAALEGEASDREAPFERWLGGGPDAVETLRLRLARGEIGVDEYERLRAALEG